MNGDRRIAYLLAAGEVTPGDASDLSHLIGQLADSPMGADLARSPGTRPSDLREYLATHMDVGRVEQWEKRLHALAVERPQVSAVVLGDQGYPRNLAAAYDAPPVLFLDGSLGSSDILALAIVGSRRASPAGLEIAHAVSQQAVGIGGVIVSGLAAGIDTAAHRGALDAGGQTIAVLPCGIDRIFPSQNEYLARRIADHGCLVSQFPPGSPPSRSTFLMRNAVISGLSSVSLVVEASERSGTRNEAEHALKQGRHVLLWEPLLAAAPWARQFANEQGVTMVTRVEQVLERLESSSAAE